MARKKLEGLTPAADAPIDGQLVAVAQSAMAERVGALAEQVGYQGDLSLPSLWDEVYLQQRRSAEAVLKLGKALLLIKEQTPHGEFQQRIDEAGIHYRMAARFMATALKFGKSDNLALLRAATTQAKVLELTVLDDEEIAALERDGALGDITLDKLERMSATQLRAEIRKLHGKIEKDGERASHREAEIDRLSTELSEAKRAIKRRTPDATAQAMLMEITQVFLGMKAQADQVAEGTRQLLEHGHGHGQDYSGDVSARANELVYTVVEMLNNLRAAGIDGPWSQMAELVAEG